MKRSDSTYFVLCQPLLVLASGFCVWQFYLGKYFSAVLVLIIVLILFITCIRLFYSARKKTTFMFNALENNDFTFRFQEDFHSNADRMFNSTLNRIKDILAKAKKDAAEREKYYELIMNCVDTAIVVIDPMGRVYQTNNEALRLFGISTLTHISQLRLLGPNVVDTLQQSAPGDRFQLSFNNERGIVTLAIAISSMKLSDKDLRIIAANDINSSLDEKEIESWSRLIRVLTHEIMNSITPITSLSDTLLKINEGANGNEQISQGLEVIGSTSRSLIAFVDSYRRLTRIPTPQKHPFYLKPFLERQMKLVLGDNGEQVHYSLTLSDDELLLYGDEDLLGQVVINLIKNGMQAAVAHAQLPGPDDAPSEKSGATINVNAYTNAIQEIIVEISDNGGGIPPEIVQNMFVPFFTTKDNGSGIGLSLSRQIMRLHNATLQLTCNTPTRTTFTLCF